MKGSRYLILVGLGFELVGLVIGALYVGQTLDKHWGTKGLMVMVVVVSCLVSWFIHLIFLLKRLEKVSEKDDSVD